jgi:hypothetical protein
MYISNGTHSIYAFYIHIRILFDTFYGKRTHFIATERILYSTHTYLESAHAQYVRDILGHIRDILGHIRDVVSPVRPA